MDFDPAKAVTSPFVAGTLGAVLGLKFAPGLTWLERLFNVTIGLASAWYVAPFLADTLQLVTVNAYSALAFAVGLFGVSIASALVENLRKIDAAEIFNSWFKRRGP